MSGLTHCVAIGLAITGLVLLLVRSAPVPSHIVSFSIFGGAMILLYLASTLYHWLPVREKAIAVLRRVDHGMIFIYIAATYTPVCLIPLRGPWGWSIFGTIWGMALAGVLMKIFWMNAPRLLSTLIYLLMGWVVVVAVYPLVLNLPLGALLWLLAGGLFYSLGAVLYAFKWPCPFKKYLCFHEIFHLLVMAGSFCHFWVMYAYIAKMA